MSKELAKTYDPKAIEEKLYERWCENKYFQAEVYNAPELKCIYCKSECPIGKELPIATEAGNIEGITVRMLSGLEDEKIDKIQKTLLRIAEDGKVEAAEREELKEMVQSLDGVYKAITELRMMAERK